MDKKDREFYALDAIDVQPDSHPPPKTDSNERKEQASFANWLLLQRSKGRKMPFVWHSTAHRSKATPGTPDFGIGTWKGWIWLEFKRDYSSPVSIEQQDFIADCEARGLLCRIVYSAAEAIRVIEQYDQLL